MKKAASKKFSFTIILVFSLAFVIAQTTIQTQKSPDLQLDNVQVINPVIGDISFITKFGYPPDATMDEDLRIQTHLEYAEHLLRQKDVSDLPFESQLKRQHLLDLLHNYWSAGKFPRNYDYMETRKPCFIDKDNTICAVGYLVEQTAGIEIAEEISQNHKYDFVYEMNDNMVDGWITSSGLSKEECAIIQPTYGGGWGDPCSGNKIWACRTSNCVTECKCVSANSAANWHANGHPCDTTINNHGNGHGYVGNNIYNISTEVNKEPAENLYPNPLSNSATIQFSTFELQKISLKIFDMSGKLVVTLVNAPYDKGVYQMEWDASNVESGIYFLVMETPNSSESRKLMVVK